MAGTPREIYERRRKSRKCQHSSTKKANEAREEATHCRPLHEPQAKQKSPLTTLKDMRSLTGFLSSTPPQDRCRTSGRPRRRMAARATGTAATAPSTADRLMSPLRPWGLSFCAASGTNISWITPFAAGRITRSSAKLSSKMTLPLLPKDKSFYFAGCIQINGG